jgi:rare lipoprotein A
VVAIRDQEVPMRHSTRIEIPGAAAVAGLGLVAALLLGGCAATRPAPSDETFTGQASYYSAAFHNRQTASGERYSKYAMTAAHRTLPFGTRVRVTHIGNGRSIVVRINDRGPFVEGRIIDLSYAAARKLGMVREGVAKVRLELL